MDDAAPAKTLADLEWTRVVAAVAARCVGPLGGAAELPLASTFAGMEQSLGETAEVADVLGTGEPPPLEGLRDLHEHLARVERMGALDGPALNDVISVVAAARALRRFLGMRRKRMPRLFEACSTDPTLDSLEDELRAAVDVDGTLFDHASAELRALRTEVANLRARLVARLEELLVKHADVLSDRYHTVRDGRYVLPVRTDAHEKLQGIVHGASASGATVFIEPRALVELGNRYRLAQAEMEREVARILALLSELVRERLVPLRAACEALDHADLRVASAKLGRDLRCTFPRLTADARIALVGARHPLLALDGVPVVPNDLAIEAGRALVISGPNAGGKTVALKTLGLAALMVRAGLPVPADEGSACGFFARVLTDVGDDQSLTKNLSTFSAHVTNVAGILESSDERTLVLLDELAGGTDPGEGAALACAVIDALCKRGAAVAVTTHYEPLKALALHDSRLRNASVGFDVQTMQPTFRVMLDVPGASSALVVAARFGIPPDVIAMAKRVLPDQARSFDELVRKLEQEWSALAIERAGLEEERVKAAAARQAAERELEALRSKERAHVSREAEQLVSIIRRTRDEVRAARSRIRARTLDEPTLEAARKVVDDAASKVALGGALEEAAGRQPLPSRELGAAPDPAALLAGVHVHVPRLRADATIVEPPQKGRVRVAAGALKLWVGVDEVRLVAAPPASSSGRSGPDLRLELPAAAEPPHPFPSDSNTLDVRGMRADDAVAMLESFLDRLYGASVRVGYVLHGHGTGALREVVRRWLSEPSAYVARSRPGLPEEGGDKYTLVWLR
jgi:DNA mismatch repair protein MutS2